MGHAKEVYDLRWSSDSAFIFSASLDFSIIIWSAEKGIFLQRLEGHNNYVKGVAVDPLGSYVISQSTDRSVRVFKGNKYKKNPNYMCRNHIRRGMFKKKDRNCIKKENEKNVESEYNLVNDSSLKVDDFKMECEKENKVNPEIERDVQNFRLFLEESALET